MPFYPGSFTIQDISLRVNPEKYGIYWDWEQRLVAFLKLHFLLLMTE